MVQGTDVAKEAEECCECECALSVRAREEEAGWGDDVQASGGEGDAPLDCWVRLDDALYQHVERDDRPQVRDVRDSDTGQGMFDDGWSLDGGRECWSNTILSLGIATRAMKTGTHHWRERL